MSIAALFTIAKTMETTKQMNGLRVHGIQEFKVHKNNGILLSHKKKNEIMPFTATLMQPETLILSEVSQKEKNKYHITSLKWRRLEAVALTQPLCLGTSICHSMAQKRKKNYKSTIL